MMRRKEPVFVHPVTCADRPVYSQDWADHMRFVMENAEVGEFYEVEHIVFMPDGTPIAVGGSAFRKESRGYSHVALENRHILEEAPAW